MNSNNFASSLKNTLGFTLLASWSVAVQQKLDGKPVGGMPPTVFTATCNPNGLLTATVGSTAYVITLSKTTRPRIPVAH